MAAQGDAAHEAKMGSASPGPQVPLEEFEVVDGDSGRSLGKGSFGVVRRVRSKISDSVYALKTMQKIEVIEGDLIDQVEREIQVQRMLKHENVLRLYNHFEDSETVYLLLEYCAKGELYQLLRTQKARRFTEAMSRHYFAQVATGLQYLHCERIVHRDLKPENLLVTHDDVLKIADFGWCAVSDTLRMTFCGTLDYLAPEMIEAKGHNQTLDIWSLGVLLYEMVVGRPPFQSTNHVTLISKILATDLRFPSWVPYAVRELVMHLLVREPAHRLPLDLVLASPWVQQVLDRTLANAGPQALSAAAAEPPDPRGSGQACAPPAGPGLPLPLPAVPSVEAQAPPTEEQHRTLTRMAAAPLSHAPRPRSQEGHVTRVLGYQISPRSAASEAQLHRAPRPSQGAPAPTPPPTSSAMQAAATHAPPVRLAAGGSHIHASPQQLFRSPMTPVQQAPFRNVLGGPPVSLSGGVAAAAAAAAVAREPRESTASSYPSSAHRPQSNGPSDRLAGQQQPAHHPAPHAMPRTPGGSGRSFPVAIEPVAARPAPSQAAAFPPASPAIQPRLMHTGPQAAPTMMRRAPGYNVPASAASPCPTGRSLSPSEGAAGVASSLAAAMAAGGAAAFGPPPVRGAAGHSQVRAAPQLTAATRRAQA